MSQAGENDDQGAPSPQSKKARRLDFVERSNKTRELILAAAEEEFVSQGLSGARIEKIANAAGVNKSLVYRHFDNKDRLFQAVLIEAYRRIRRAEHLLPVKEDAETLVAQFCEATLSYFIKNPNFLILVGIENLHRGQNLKDLPPREIQIDELLTRLDAIIRQGQAEGRFRQGPKPIDLWMLLSSQCWFAVATAYTANFAFGKNIFDKPVYTERLANIQDSVRRFLLTPQILLLEEEETAAAQKRAAL